MTDHADIVLNYKQLARERGIKGDKLCNKVIGQDDPLDAFRHTYANSIATKYIGSPLSEFIFFLVEVIGNNDPGTREMDEHNNSVGRQIGKQYRNKTNDKIADAVAEAIKNGKTINHPRDCKQFKNKLSPEQAVLFKKWFNKITLDHLMEDLEGQDLKKLFN